jgi:RNase P/RNase MRP subunit p29
MLKSPTNNLNEAVMQKLLRLDYQGSVVRVVIASNVSLVNVHGLLLQDLCSVWVVLTPETQLKKVQKMGTVLDVEIASGTTVSLFGKQWCGRAAERVNKKWKAVKDLI